MQLCPTSDITCQVWAGHIGLLFEVREKQMPSFSADLKQEHLGGYTVAVILAPQGEKTRDRAGTDGGEPKNKGRNKVMT